MERRALLKLIASTLGALPLGWVRLRAEPDRFTPQQLVELKHLAAVVLPSSLGRAATDDIAERFARWARHYKPGAETDHGYGLTRLRRTPPSPVPAYLAQLAVLDRTARARGSALADLAPEARRQIVEAALASARIDELPPRPNGAHIASDLMSFYFRSSEANDLCYQAAIGRDSCRGLPESDEAPARVRTDS